MIKQEDFQNEDYDMMTDIAIETALSLVEYPTVYDCDKTADDVYLRVRMSIYNQIRARLKEREEKLKRAEKVMKLLMEREERQTRLDTDNQS